MGVNFVDYVLSNQQLSPLGITVTKQRQPYSEVNARTCLWLADDQLGSNRSDHPIQADQWRIEQECSCSEHQTDYVKT